MTRPTHGVLGPAALVACLALVWPTPAAAQAADPHVAQPERPTVSTHAGTVAPGWAEIEAGVELDRYDDGSRGALGPVALKLGLAPRLQLTLQESIVRAPGGQTAGVGDAGFGVKWRILEHRSLLGDLAVQPGVKFPAGSVSAGRGTGTTDISLLVISSHAIGPVSLDVNYGFTGRSGDGSVAPRHASLWAAAAGESIKGRLGWTSEVFGFPATPGPAGAERIVGAIGGATFAWRDWLVLDAGVEVPLLGPQPREVFAGVVYNVGQIWRP